MSRSETGSGSGSTGQPYPLSKGGLLKGPRSVASSHSKNTAGSICDSEDGAGSVLLPLTLKADLQVESQTKHGIISSEATQTAVRDICIWYNVKWNSSESRMSACYSV